MGGRSRLMSVYGQSLMRRGEWTRRAALVGSAHPKRDVLISDMAGLASDLLGLPVVEFDAADIGRRPIGEPSVLVCEAEGPVALAGLSRLTADGHRVIAAVKPETVPDIFELIADVAPAQPLRTGTLLATIGFAASLADIPSDEDGTALLTYVTVDAEIQRSLVAMQKSHWQRPVLNSLEIEFCDGRNRYSRHTVIMPALDELEIANITIIGGLGPLSDSSDAPTITGREI